MRHFFSTKVRIALVVALLLTAGLAVLTSLTGVTVGDLLVKGILTPFRSGAQALTAQAEKCTTIFLNTKPWLWKTRH